MSANLEYNGFGLFSSTEPRFYNIFTFFIEKTEEHRSPVLVYPLAYAFIYAGCAAVICLSRSINSSPVIVSRSSKKSASLCSALSFCFRI